MDRDLARRLAAAYGTPLYVYDLDVVRARCRALRAAIAYRPFQPLYAVKANPCPAVVRTIIDEGFGIDAVSPGEVRLALRLGLSPARVLYTENSMSDAEQAEALAAGVLITAGSLDRLERLAAAGAQAVAVRFNPDVGAGAHPKICTAGPLTKFGIPQAELPRVLEISRRRGLRVVGAHMHIGSGFLESAAFAAACRVIFALARQLPDLAFVDCGGGLGIPYRPGEEPMDLAAFGAQLSADAEAFSAAYGQRIELRLEPGRFLVAEAGTLLTTVTSVKRTPWGRTFVGCDTGFNHLVRVAMYDAYHRIENLSRPEAEPAAVDIVGNICESGDVFARERLLPMPEVGDLLAIRDAGAYGFAMASHYNLRPLPAEVVIDGGQPRLARPRQTLDELLAGWRW
ncbi:MAG: diaminopimelate decarboxylase [Planctomycetes bacterium]|nr:diaminopimelate decarboxylase [Planctomycetota bacterium]